MNFQQWLDDGVLKLHHTPPYAIADMKAAYSEIKSYVARAVVPSILAVLGTAMKCCAESFPSPFGGVVTPR